MWCVVVFRICNCNLIVCVNANTTVHMGNTTVHMAFYFYFNGAILYSDLSYINITKKKKNTYYEK